MKLNEKNKTQTPGTRPFASPRHRSGFSFSTVLWCFIAVVCIFFWFINMNAYSGNPIIGLCCLLLVPMFIGVAYLSSVDNRLMEIRDLLYYVQEQKEDAEMTVRLLGAMDDSEKDSKT